MNKVDIFCQYGISVRVRENYELLWCIMDDKGYAGKERETLFSKWWYDEGRTYFPNMPDDDFTYCGWKNGKWYQTDRYMYTEIDELNRYNEEHYGEVPIQKIVKAFNILFSKPTGAILRFYVEKDVKDLAKFV